jgi:hypothetical protein
MDEKLFCGPEAVCGPQLVKTALANKLYITNLQHHVMMPSVLQISTLSYHEQKVNNGGIRRQKVRALKTSAHVSRIGLILRHKEMNSNLHCYHFTRLHLSPSMYCTCRIVALHHTLIAASLQISLCSSPIMTIYTPHQKLIYLHASYLKPKC